MQLELNDGELFSLAEDPSNPLICCEDRDPVLGELATFLCGNGIQRMGYGRGQDLGPAVFYEPEDMPQLMRDHWPMRPMYWKKGPTPVKIR